MDDEDASYFSSDVSGFVCGNCTRECELSDDTPVVYGDIPIPFCSDECEAEWLALEDDFGTLIDYGKSFPSNSRQILSI